MNWEKLLFDLVQISLTVSLAALVPLLLRQTLKKHYPARTMCLIWAVLALRLLAPVQFTLAEPPVQVTPRTNYLLHRVILPASGASHSAVQVLDPANDSWLTDTQAAVAERYDRNPVTTFNVTALLTALWLAGGALFLGAQAVCYTRYARRLRRDARAPEREALRAVFERTARALDIARPIPLRISPAADCPMLAGFVRPVLYLPDESMSPRDAAFVIRHELTHYKHHDLWLKLALVLARAVQWFNPLVHLMAYFAQEDIELACDDAVARGMSRAQRRAYGETILRAAAVQAKRRALVSCFTGGKKTLMHRLEGLFDKRAKKRGMVLVLAMAVLVVSLGCAFSVGEDAEKLTETRRTELAEAWARESGHVYSVKTAGGQTYVIFAKRQTDGTRVRTVERLLFGEKAGKAAVMQTEIIADTSDGVHSFEEFRLLYENDLGLPDLLDMQGAAWELAGLDLRTPARAAVSTLGLAGGAVAAVGPCVVYRGDSRSAEGVAEVLYRFADGSEAHIILVNQFGQGWLPQDWTDAHDRNARNTADLTQQFAHAVSYKSGQYLYPILSAANRQKFIERQQDTDAWNWKLGGSSPSYRNFILLPGKKPEQYIVVFQRYGGGVTDYRSAYVVTTGQEGGRSVITDVQACVAPNYTQSDLFRLYYAMGLPWPQLDEGAQTFNGAALSALSTPAGAITPIFSHTPDTSPFRIDAVTESQNGTTAIVRLRFGDGSEDVRVHMRQEGGIWLPVGLADVYDGFAPAAYHTRSTP